MDNNYIENKGYIERRNYIKAVRSRRHLRPVKRWNSSLFLLRANICMAVAVLIVIASYIESEPTNALCDKVKMAVGTNINSDDIKDFAVTVYDSLLNRDLAVMAGSNKALISLDDEIIDTINSKKDIYYNNQKKTQ